MVDQKTVIEKTLKAFTFTGFILASLIGFALLWAASFLFELSSLSIVSQKLMVVFLWIGAAYAGTGLFRAYATRGAIAGSAFWATIFTMAIMLVGSILLTGFLPNVIPSASVISPMALFVP